MVTRASRALWTEVNPEYQVDPRDFTDADIAAGKLREADEADTAQNRAIVRRVLEAAFPDAWLPDDVRELLADLAQGGYGTGSSCPARQCEPSARCWRSRCPACTSRTRAA
jgi:hypothetical protein